MKWLLYLLMILLTNSATTPDAPVMELESEVQLISYGEYDFDSDGVMERVITYEGMGIINYKIYKTIGNDMALIGTITADYDGEISKYYDSQKDVYFILSDYILNKDDWFYYDAVRFDFQEEQMEKKGDFFCKWNYIL